MSKAQELIEERINETSKVTEESLKLAPATDLVNIANNVNSLLNEAQRQLEIATPLARSNHYLKKYTARTREGIKTARYSLDELLFNLEDY